MVAHLYLLDERPPQQWSRDQIASARANGCSAGGYVFGYPDLDPRLSVQQAGRLAAECDLVPPVLWLDAETYQARPGVDLEWLQAAIDECLEFGFRPGIYTGAWYISQYLPELGSLPPLPLWIADYNGQADLVSVQAVSPWGPEWVWGHQWTDEPCDRSVFDPRATELAD